jgi:hypothetical protein
MLIHNLHQDASIVAENTNTIKQNAPLLERSVGNVGNPIILKACANQVTRQDHVNKEYELYLMNLMTKTMITLKYTLTLTNVISVTIIGKNKNTRMTRFQLDSGATCNIITANVLKELEIKELQKKTQILTMYNNTIIKPIGKCKLKLVNPKNNEKFIAEFVVIKDETLTPLLGNKAVQAMSLLTINYENIKAVREGAPSEPLSKEKVMKEFADVFEGTGKLQGKYHLELDENATPIVHPPRKVPVAIKERLRNKLERLTKMDIIKPVSTPTPWVSSLVTVVKPGKLRICIDPKHLNQNIKRSHYPLPTIEDLLPDLSKANIFSVVDA